MNARTPLKVEVRGSLKSTRRSFLVGAGGMGLGLPLLGSLMVPRRALGDPLTFPKRLVVFFTPNGVNPDVWFPTPGASDTEFTLHSALTPLIPHQQDIVVTSGINMDCTQPGPGEPHQRGMGAVLSGAYLQEGTFVGGDGSLAGWGNGISVDQYLAPRIAGPGQRRSLELGVRVLGAEVRTRINYSGPGSPVPPENDPRQAFHRLFDGFSVPPNEAERLSLARRNVLSAVKRNFERMRPKVSTEDRIKLDRHRAFIVDLDQRLAAMGTGGLHCAVPSEPPSLSPADAEQHMDDVLPLQMDLAVAALSCDVTRVITIQCSTGANNIRFPWLQSYTDDHVLSHAGPSDTTSQQEWADRKVWYAQHFASFLQKLKSVPEGTGTLLDNTLILWCSELSQGNTHSHSNMPFLLAGRAGGAIQTGRYLRYQNQPHNNLLLSILHAFGVMDSTFGEPAFCTGPLPGLL